MAKRAMNLQLRETAMEAPAATHKGTREQAPSSEQALGSEQALSSEQAPSPVPSVPEAARGDGPTVPSPERRREMIAIAAYRRAERRGFSEGSPEQDWFEAEAEIDRVLEAYSERTRELDHSES